MRSASIVRTMRMKTLLDICPDASKSCQERNPTISGNKNALQATANAKKRVVSWVSKGGMNKTEYQFSLILEAQKRNGEILRYEYEGITLRWAGIRYTPDFVVFIKVPELIPWVKLIEVKGGRVKGVNRQK